MKLIITRTANIVSAFVGLKLTQGYEATKATAKEMMTVEMKK